MNEEGYENHTTVSNELNLSQLADNENFYLEVKKLWWGKDAFEVIIVDCQMFGSVVVALLRAFNLTSTDGVFTGILVGTLVSAVVLAGLGYKFRSVTLFLKAMCRCFCVGHGTV